MNIGLAFAILRLLLVGLIFVPSAAFSFDRDDSVILEVFIESPSGLDGLYIVRDFEDKLLTDRFENGFAEIILEREDVTLRKSIILAKWEDGYRVTMPVLLTTAFSGRTIQFYLIRIESRSGDLDCPDTQPQSIEAAFRHMYVCAHMAKIAETEAAGQRTWTRDHIRGLNGWLIANHWLYTRASVSPYRMDPQLMVRLEKIVGEVDNRRYSKGSFLPLRVEDARSALRQVQEEEVRAAGLVPDLLRARDVLEAGRANAAARDRLLSIADSDSSVVIDGVDLDLLRANEAYLDTISVAIDDSGPLM